MALMIQLKSDGLNPDNSNTMLLMYIILLILIFFPLFSFAFIWGFQTHYNLLGDFGEQH